MRMLIVVLAALGLPAVPAAAGPVTLVQDGWTFGGPLTVTFLGTDGNLDGEIDQSELAAFEAVFLLPLGGSTTWLLGDLQPGGFLYIDPSDFLFFATNADYTLIDSAFLGLVSGAVINQFLFPVDLTDRAPVVVPEPAGLALAGLGGLAAAAWLRRSHAGRKRFASNPVADVRSRSANNKPSRP